MEKGVAIRRCTNADVNFWDRFAIIPTNTRDCCYIIRTDISNDGNLSMLVGRRWDPLAEDLLADDWEIADYFVKSDLTTLI